MANSLIQIKQSFTNTVPVSLNVGELAYSYVSNSMFIGSPTSDGYINVGGLSTILSLEASFAQANAAFLKANSGFESQNSSGNYANAALIKANSAYQSQNSTGQYANAGFTVANGAFFHANAAFLKANSAYESQNTTGIYANSAYQSQNATGQYANAAFIRANNAVNANLGGTITATTAATSNTSGALIISGGLGVKGNVYTGSIVITGASNTITFVDGTVQNTSPVAIGNYANAAFTYSNGAFLYANTAFANANAALAKANAAFANANAAFTAANLSYNQANSGFIQANSAYAQANAAYLSQNSTGNYANAAFTRANNSLSANVGGIVTGDVTITGNLLVTGNTTYVNTSQVLIADNIITLNAAIDQTSAPVLNAGIEVDRGSAANVYVLWNESGTKWTVTNDGINYFNIGSDAAESYANSGFIKANAAFGHANAAYLSQNATGQYANSAYQSQNATGQYANSAFTVANGAFFHANAAYISQNATGQYANAAFNLANSAYQSQNATGQYANAAFIRANNSLNANVGGNVTGEVVIIGNLTSNTITTTGSNGSISGANAIFTNYIFAANGNVDLYIYSSNAFANANAALAKANAAFANANGAYVAANLSYNHANSAYQSQNSTGQYANAAFISANSAYQSQNATGQYANAAFTVANGAFFHANASYISQNATGQYANAAFANANGAFAKANAAFIWANSAYDKANTDKANLVNSGYTAQLYANGNFKLPGNLVFTGDRIIDGGGGGSFVITANDAHDYTGLYLNDSGNQAVIYSGGDILLQTNGLGASHDFNFTAAGNLSFPDGTLQNTSVVATSYYANSAFASANASFIKANAAFATANVKTETFVQASEPAGANVDDIWIDSSSGIQYVYINSNSSNQWVEFSAYGTPLNGTANVQFADQTISPVYPARPLVLSTSGDLHLNASANVVTFNVVPSNPTISLGSSDRPFKNVWISNASIHMEGNGIVGGAQPVRITNDANNVVIESGGMKIRGGALQANSFLDISHLYALNVESSFIVSNATFSSTNALVKIVGSNTGFAQPPTNPGYMLHLTGKVNTASRIVNDSFGADANTYPLYVGRAARGSAENPTAVKAGDILARYSGNGYDGTNYASFGTGRIDIIAVQDHTTLNKGTSIILSTMANNTNVLSNIANFDGNTSTFYGTVQATKGYLQLPRVANNGGDSVAVTIDFANDSIVRATIVSNMTVNFVNYIAGKSVQLWVYNRDTGGGSAHTVTHGVAATNATNQSTTKSIPGPGLAVFQYVSWDANLANTQVVIHQG